MTAWIDGAYRYSLERDTGELVAVGACCFVMLNPSTADEVLDDPTIRKCRGFARRWGFARLTVVNLFAFRATNPKDLWAQQRAGGDVVGYSNDAAIRIAVQDATRVVVAWGKVPTSARDRIDDVCSRLYEWSIPKLCLGVNLDGSPKHPLYVSYDVQPRSWCWETP